MHNKALSRGEFMTSGHLEREVVDVGGREEPDRRAVKPGQ